MVTPDDQPVLRATTARADDRPDHPSLYLPAGTYDGSTSSSVGDSDSAAPSRRRGSGSIHAAFSAGRLPDRGARRARARSTSPLPAARSVRAHVARDRDHVQEEARQRSQADQGLRQRRPRSRRSRTRTRVTRSAIPLADNQTADVTVRGQAVPGARRASPARSTRSPPPTRPAPDALTAPARGPAPRPRTLARPTFSVRPCCRNPPRSLRRLCPTGTRAPRRT